MCLSKRVLNRGTTYVRITRVEWRRIREPQFSEEENLVNGNTTPRTAKVSHCGSPEVRGMNKKFVNSLNSPLEMM